MGGAEGMCSAWGNRVIHVKLWLETLKEKTEAKPHAYVPCAYERRVLLP
jgi:hypothetical protein